MNNSKKILFDKPTDCIYCKGITKGVLGSTYTCCNDKSKYYMQIPLICFGKCKYYKKEMLENE